MQIPRFSQISGTCCLILGILINVPASGHRPDDLRCDALTKHEKKVCELPDPEECRSFADLKKDLSSDSEFKKEDLLSNGEPKKEALLTDGKLTEDEWKCWEKGESDAAKGKARLADGKYQHKMGSWSGQGSWKRPLAFFSRSMSLTGKIQETDGVNTGLDGDGLPGHFDTSKTLREISFGWSKKKILEDGIVMLFGPETLAKAKKNAIVKHLSLSRDSRWTLPFLTVALSISKRTSMA